MTLSLTEMPLYEAEPTPDAQPTSVKLIDRPADRRTLMRGMALGAVTVGALVAGLSDRLTAPATAAGRRTALGPKETSSGGLQGWTSPNCAETGYGGGSPITEPPMAPSQMPWACVGPRVGPKNCDSEGWHQTRAYRENGFDINAYPQIRACDSANGMNSWRWKPGGTKPNQPNDGNTYRCSDGWQDRHKNGVSEIAIFTICQGRAS
ncbi:hypothetical protein GCM10010124_13160 [Pilimelia terevasa]|uniref:Uncharacterized protein n=1 Tax=Pilimelia terevasa TaxID=53372 RepID=A0A8J3FFV9_9ACTN|nr:hypothetical protein [Pilimelia terevasa]GGK22036.1 hypothetical protein GCM10010124_13160 [Pilimelia terevasa]